jgi:hypothetical protein
MTLRNLAFVNNSAEQGGAIFYRIGQSLLPLKSCQLIENTFQRYGPTFASTAKPPLVWRRAFSFKNITVSSGSTLPAFSLLIRDVFNQEIVPSELQGDFLFLNLTLSCPQSLESNQLNFTSCGSVEVEVAKPWVDSPDGILFSKTEVVGYPGNYLLLVAPILNYDPKVFFVSQNITISNCTAPLIWHFRTGSKYPRCEMRKAPCDLYVISI